MVEYLLKRLLLFIPTLLIISVFAFWLSRQTPGDPVREFLPAEYSPRDYCQESKRLGYEMPPFYFRIATCELPDTLYRICPPEKEAAMEALCRVYGQWPAVETYFTTLEELASMLENVPDSLGKEPHSLIRRRMTRLREAVGPEAVQAELDGLDAALGRLPDTNAAVSALKRCRRQFEHLSGSRASSVPAISWYGTQNRYHQWLKGILRGDFGTSYSDGRPVSSRIGDALFWTLIINLSAIFLAFSLAIPIGVWGARRRSDRSDRLVTLLLFFLYSLPVFWIGTMLIVFFTTPEYGMDLFPSIGLGGALEGSGFWKRTFIRAGHLLLPVACLTYPALAFIARQMRGSMVAELSKDYIRTARAKGLSERAVVWRHAFPNALFPIITLLAGVFPAAIAGSVVIEVIFNIPGMGKLMVDGILQRDWPVVFAVMLLGAFLTIIGIFIADMVYKLADPRVRLGR